MSLWSIGHMTNSTWSVSNVTGAHSAARGGNGGVLSLAADIVDVISSLEVAHIGATGASAKRGGVLSTEVVALSDSLCSLSNLRMNASTASGEGGGVYVSIQSAERARLLLTEWHATNLTARDGAVGLLSHADSFSGTKVGLDVLASRFHVQGAHAAQEGGVLAIHSGRPYQIPWRTHNTLLCGGSLPCTLPRYNSTQVPLAYAVRVRALDWVARNVSARKGGVAAVGNVDASFSDIDGRRVTATSSGGLWSVSGYTTVSAQHITATIDPASADARGLLLDQSQSPSNLSLSNVSARLINGAQGSAAGHEWIHTGALSPPTINSIAMQCPVGATLENTSIGRVQLTESPFTVVEQFSTATGHVNRKLSIAETFPYLSASLGCSMCPEGKYVFASLAWVSPDVHGAVCTPGFDANASFPLCHNAPMDKARCIDCPTGAVCHGGANVTAQVGRWGTTSQGDEDTLISVFPLLQFGYACSSPSCQQRYDSCAGNRTGFACGHCRRGFGEALGSPECIADKECIGWPQNLAWAAFALGCTVAAALSITYAGARSMGVTSGLATILLVLFQSEAIIRTNDGGGASLLSQLAMLDISLPGARVCLWPGMSARAKALIPLCSFFGVLGMIGLFYAAHWLLFRRSAVIQPPSMQQYKRALVSLFLASYSAVASACIKLITPTVVDQGWHQSLTGEAWMATADQWIALLWLVTSSVPTPFWFWYGIAHLREGTISDVRFGLGLLFPIPAALWPRLLVRRHMTRHEKQAARGLYHKLAAPYSDRFWYWSGVFLAQRLVLGLISILMASNHLYRAYAMALTACVLVTTYIHLHVFATPTVNAAHAVALAGLFIICFSNGVAATTHQLGFSATTGLLAVHQSTSWSLWVVPIAAIAAKLYAGHAKTSGKDATWYELTRRSWRPTRRGLSAPLMAGEGQ